MARAETATPCHLPFPSSGRRPPGPTYLMFLPVELTACQSAALPLPSLISRLRIVRRAMEK